VHGVGRGRQGGIDVAPGVGRSRQTVAVETPHGVLVRREGRDRIGEGLQFPVLDIDQFRGPAGRADVFGHHHGEHVPE
jgi:hypothetical protein